MKKVISAILAISILFALCVPTASLADEVYTPSAVQKAPFIAGPNGEAIVILKFDDLGAGNFNGFKRLYEYCKANGVHASFGAIGNKCVALSADQLAEIKTWTENGIEIWCHGYNHSIDRNQDPYRSDYQNTTYASMKTNVQNTLDIFSPYGIEIKSIGAPYNLNDDMFLDMLNKEFPDVITSLLYGKDASKIFDGYCLNNRVNVESATAVASLATFEASYAKYTANTYMVIQAHPGGYDDANFKELTDSIALMKSEGLRFMTPSEYITYIEEAAAEAVADTKGLHLTNASVTGTTVQYTAANTAENSIQSAVVIAAYKNGILVDLHLQSITANSGAADTHEVTLSTGNFDRVKLFAVQDIFSMRLTASAITALP